MPGVSACGFLERAPVSHFEPLKGIHDNVAELALLERVEKKTWFNGDHDLTYTLYFKLARLDFLDFTERYI